MKRIGYYFGVMTLLLSGAAMAAAQQSGAETEPLAAAGDKTPTPPVDPELQTKLDSPRQCFDTFYLAASDGAWNEAMLCLNLDGFDDPAAARANGDSYVYRLKRIIDSVALDAESISSDAEFEGVCRLLQHAVNASDGSPLEGWKKTDFNLIAISRDADDQLWRFSAGTVMAIDEIWKRWEVDVDQDSTLAETGQPLPFKDWLRARFPKSLHARHFLIDDYMWICLLAVVLLGLLADRIVGFFAIHLTQAWLRISRSEMKDKAGRRLWKPLGLLVQALVWYYGTMSIGIDPKYLSVLRHGLRFFAVVAGVWVVFRLIDVISDYLNTRAQRTPSRFDDLLIPLLSKSLKITVIVVGTLICAEAFGLPYRTLLGGLGLGGAALALASKDAISNFFGSLTVLVDRPFEIGDWVIADDIEGTVETVGFRSTRIRTFYNSLITLPNSRLTTTVVDNMGRRRYRRIKTVIGVEYRTTPEQIDAFCEGIRELIRRNSCTRKDYFHVYFHNFSDSSLDILLYFFLRVPDWSTELRERHRLFTEILRLAQDLRISFAFPTRTLHMHPEQASPAPHVLPHDDAERFGKESAARIVEHLQGNAHGPSPTGDS